MKIKKGQHYCQRGYEPSVWTAAEDFEQDGCYPVTVTGIREPLWSTKEAWAWLGAWNDRHALDRSQYLDVSRQAGRFFMVADHRWGKNDLYSRLGDAGWTTITLAALDENNNNLRTHWESEVLAKRKDLPGLPWETLYQGNVTE